MGSTKGAVLLRDLPGTLITLLKKVLLIALGSGLLSNTLFIYGWLTIKVISKPSVLNISYSPQIGAMRYSGLMSPAENWELTL